MGTVDVTNRRSGDGGESSGRRSESTCLACGHPIRMPLPGEVWVSVDNGAEFVVEKRGELESQYEYRLRNPKPEAPWWHARLSKHHHYCEVGSSVCGHGVAIWDCAVREGKWKFVRGAE